MSEKTKKKYRVNTTTTKEVKEYVENIKGMTYQHLITLGYMVSTEKMPIVRRQGMLEEKYDLMNRKMDRILELLLSGKL